MNGIYKDREPSEVEPLANELYEQLEWFFSDKYIEVNIKPYNAYLTQRGYGELHHNNFAYINAHTDLGSGECMIIEPPTSDKRGYSFWGTISKSKWKGISKVAKMQLCTEKAKEILHLKD